MQFHTTPLPGAALVDLKLLEDERGFFARAFCRQEFIDAGLEPLVEQADHVVPGHGGPIDGTRALAILREDRAYLEALGAGEDAPLPLARRTKSQRAIHAKNLTRR